MVSARAGGGNQEPGRANHRAESSARAGFLTNAISQIRDRQSTALRPHSGLQIRGALCGTRAGTAERVEVHKWKAHPLPSRVPADSEGGDSIAAGWRRGVIKWHGMARLDATSEAPEGKNGTLWHGVAGQKLGTVAKWRH